MYKKENAKYVGFGLILGVAIGFSLGLILLDQDYASIFAGTGAGIGIILGSIIARSKSKIN